MLGECGEVCGDEGRRRIVFTGDRTVVIVRVLHHLPVPSVFGRYFW